MTTLLSGSELPAHVLKPFISILAEQLGGSASTPNKQDIAVQCLESLLSNPVARKEVWNQTRVIRA
jgi:V-type H+-transporting ATPase subunit H